MRAHTHRGVIWQGSLWTLLCEKTSQRANSLTRPVLVLGPKPRPELLTSLREYRRREEREKAHFSSSFVCCVIPKQWAMRIGIQYKFSILFLFLSFIQFTFMLLGGRLGVFSNLRSCYVYDMLSVSLTQLRLAPASPTMLEWISHLQQHSSWKARQTLIKNKGSQAGRHISICFCGCVWCWLLMALSGRLLCPFPSTSDLNLTSKALSDHSPSPPPSPTPSHWQVSAKHV